MPIGRCKGNLYYIYMRCGLSDKALWTGDPAGAIIVFHVKRLPRKWKTRRWPEILAEADLKVSKHSRLRAKLLIFSSMTAMRRCCRKHPCMKNRVLPPRDCDGAVYDLCLVRSSAPRWKPRYEPTDPRYFAIICLINGCLSSEIVAHEACHAAFSYAQRRARKYWESPHESHEELVCYPMGRLFREINLVLHREGFWE